MAEERIIDDEYGREVRLRKTKEGYVDVTDELAEGQDTEQNVEERGEEIAFAYPMLDEEDDEDLVGLSPEEAAALRKQKIEAAQRQRAEYEQTVAEGNALLDTDSFHAAELKFEKALGLDLVATEASVGYWRAKTANFTNPDALIEEYVDAGIESLEYDLGYEAAEIIKKEYRGAFQRRFEELSAEEAPLRAAFTEKQERRRGVLKARKKKHLISFLVSGIPFLLFTVLAIVFGLKNFSTPDNTYIPVTIAFAAIAVVAFFVFAVFSNKLLNTCRIFSANEKMTSTEEGEELVRITEYKDLYAALLVENAPFEEDEAPAEESVQAPDGETQV